MGSYPEKRKPIRSTAMNNRTVIFYFSGTGNTKWAAGVLADELAKRNHSVLLHSVEESLDTAGMLAACGTVVIAFPVYASFAPRIMTDFIASLPPGRNIRLVGMTTAGYMAGDVLHYAFKTLSNRGYRLLSTINLRVGNNMHLPLLSPLPVTSGGTLRQNMEKAKKRIAAAADRLESGRPFRDGSGPFAYLFGVIQRFIAATFEAHAFKGFHADESCTACGWCVRSCPVQNITFGDGHPRFGDCCILCMRCYSYCPVHAVQLGEKTKNTDTYKRYTAPVRPC